MSLVMGKGGEMHACEYAHMQKNTLKNTHTVSREGDGVSSEPLPLRMKQTLPSLGSLANHNR